jgi:anti-sigma factor RsiW
MSTLLRARRQLHLVLAAPLPTKSPMTCNQASTILHSYFDNELDTVGAAAFESRLERRSECLEGLEALSSLRSSMNLGQLYEKAPASLRKKVFADFELPACIGKQK